MQQTGNSEAGMLVDHLFRQESGKMVAVLTRLFGFPNVEYAEDIVQDTLLKALEAWGASIPANPQAWLYKVAKNQAVDVIRKQQLKYRVDADLAIRFTSEYTLVPAVDELFLDGEIADSQLRMMFACCHPVLSQEAQISLILRTLCGLSCKEIASAFLTREDTVSKRLFRTREKIRSERIALDYPDGGNLNERLDVVLKTLYLLFSEGYNSTCHENLIREELCEEAMRLVLLLTGNERTNLPRVNALLALMCFQVARFDARLDEKGLIILLKDQDRSKWNKFLISKGNEFLDVSANGTIVSNYHLEAAIASIHANALCYEATDWNVLLRLYDQLLQQSMNPIVALNRCLVIGELAGNDVAIAELTKLESLRRNHHYQAALGELLLNSGDHEEARRAFETALELAPSATETELIKRKLRQCYCQTIT